MTPPVETKPSKEASGTVGMIGLGRVGLAVAQNLVEAGYDVIGCARGRSAELVAVGGRVDEGAKPRDVAAAADVVFLSLPTADAFTEVISGVDGILEASSPPSVVVDLGPTATEPVEAAAAALLAGKTHLISSPISGTPEMVAAKRATAFACGDPQGFEMVADTLRAAIPGAAFVGPLGTGVRFKFIANLLVGVHAAAAAEAVALAKLADLDADLLVELISASPGATSGQFNIRAPMMVSGEFKMLGGVDHLIEVLDGVEALADEVGASTPLVRMANSLYMEMHERGEGDLDIARMVLLFEERARSAGIGPAESPAQDPQVG